MKNKESEANQNTKQADNQYSYCEKQKEQLLQGNCDHKNDLDSYKEAYKHLQKEEDKQPEIDDICQALIRLGVPINKNQVQKEFFNQLDKDNDGKISFEEFYSYAQNKRKQFYDIFIQIAQQKDGNEPYIIINDLKDMANKLKLKISQNQIEYLVNQIDCDHNGKITFDEFLAYFALLPNPHSPKEIFEAFYGDTFVDDGGNGFILQKELYRGQNDSKLIFFKLLSGAISGAVARTFTAPLDRIKILMQTKKPGSGEIRIKDVVKYIWEEGGWKGFFKGNYSNCFKVAPETAIRFYIFDYLKNRFSQDNQQITITERFMSGGIAGAIAEICIYPLEISKAKMALCKRGQFKGIYDCLKQTYKLDGGIKGLYPGLLTTVIGIFPYQGIDLALNSLLRDQASKILEKKQQEPGVAIMLGCGMVSSTTALLLISPLNVIRIRLQANGIMPPDQRFNGPLDVVQKIWKGDGYKGFYRGVIPTMIKVIPATSISYATYGKLQAFFHNQFKF